MEQVELIHDINKVEKKRKRKRERQEQKLKKTAPPPKKSRVPLDTMSKLLEEEEQPTKDVLSKYKGSKPNFEIKEW